MTKPDLQTNLLTQLHADIETRVQTIRADHPDWLCRMGCDGCCRRLAEVPSLTSAEWDLLKEGLAALPSELLREIGRNIETLPEKPLRPILCPLLDLSAGACRVYAHRPAACRTYGFYVQRDKGLYCKDIESRVAGGAWSEVVWGNQDAIDRRLQDLGDTRELPEWFVGWNMGGDAV
ncbi:MAG: YkgJ family cysteine cluster protein [Methylosarcina sp.]